MIPRIKSGNTLKIFSFYFIIFSNYLKSNEKGSNAVQYRIRTFNDFFQLFKTIHKSTLRKIFFANNPLKINSGNRNQSVLIKIPNDLKVFNNDIKSYFKKHEKAPIRQTCECFEMLIVSY